MATTSGPRQSFPVLRLLMSPFRWFFRSRRRVMTALAVLLGLIATPFIWWNVQLTGLPDIGDPFDVAEFRAMTIPDERNAYVLYQRAAERLRPLSASDRSSGLKVDVFARWSEAAPLLRKRVDDNREALEIFRQGSGRPDAFELPRGSNPDPDMNVFQAMRWLQWLSLVEASRLEDQGDMAGAWTWYRAVLRATHHMGLRASSMMRWTAAMLGLRIHDRVKTWAADPRTTPEMIRRALGDVVACGTMVPSESYTLKAEYLGMERWLDGPLDQGRQETSETLKAWLKSRGYQLDSDRIRSMVDAWRKWRREPERGRRVLRLTVANWLAYLDTPPDRRPAPAPDVVGRQVFYAFGPEAPATARTVSPKALDRWLQSSLYAQAVIASWNLNSIRIRERVNHRALVILLASELYRRDHKSEPPSDEAIIGPYLKELPDDGTGDLP